MEAVAVSAVKVQSTAVKKFGTYQPGVGGFPAWAPLAESTIEQKAKAGGGEDPLIGHYVHKTGGGAGGSFVIQFRFITRDLWASIGTNDPVGVYQEYGTSRGIPPRPFLQPALYEEQGFIKTEVRKAIINTLKGI